ncbi:MAG: hypothetical protein KKD90_00025 [Candidatus Omnitrophica bacterium]|nr:hypothetical protein [Candidatus Omnitrophota bacterium]MBU4149214.1 hypothetical protein [Candidatus Omnitrophota bacterium]
MSHITPEERLLELIKKAQGSLKIKKELKIFNKVNIILIGIIVIVISVFAMDVVKSKKNISDLEADLSGLKIMPLPQPADIKEIAVEDIKEAVVAKIEMPAPEKSLAVDLNLLGIITGDEKQAIIEDRKEGKAYFLYPGDNLEGFEVISITDTGVILDRDGEKIELKI